jgi:hypothetical protein
MRVGTQPWLRGAQPQCHVSAVPTGALPGGWNVFRLAEPSSGPASWHSDGLSAISTVTYCPACWMANPPMMGPFDAKKTVKAKVGDWLEIEGTTTEQHDQRGLITEVPSEDGSPPYVVRWIRVDPSDAVRVPAQRCGLPVVRCARSLDGPLRLVRTSLYMAAPTPSLRRCIPRWSTSGREVRSAMTTTDVLGA